MCLKRTILTFSLLSPLVLVVPGASAGEQHDHDHKHEQEHEDEHREHGAHVHGIAALNLALEGRDVHVELDSPAANIVGFEHTPSSEADHAALDKAVATLKDGDRLFRFNEDAGCRTEDVRVASALLEKEHGEHADEHSDDRAHEEKGGHEHEGEVHSDIEAAYHFECTKPGKLTQLTVELFEAFPGMEKLKVQYVIETKQGAAELTASNHVVTF
ncbi:DUF2796 domain-containing protein [Candidatus Thiosymbion oneisti]|uniref:DUF2796 domain-containing protein n=1 Tax=Candidatus Thiosymbion oneisti TaxID=589554 RepID=UPI000A5D4420|nr:DUF2796 domain-containing protein [Candidatus Thiosymbion oneisti]